MGEFLSEAEVRFKKALKDDYGIIMDIQNGGLESKNGGVKCVCGDGRADAILFQRAKVHHQTNVYTPPGGPLVFSHEFIRLSRAGFAARDLDVLRRGHVISIEDYMRLRRTRTIFNTFHYPCGAANDVGIGIKALFTRYIPEIIGFFNGLSETNPEYFIRGKIHYKIHFRIKEEGEPVDRTYIINTVRLLENIICLEKLEAA